MTTRHPTNHAGEPNTVTARPTPVNYNKPYLAGESPSGVRLRRENDPIGANM
jgi:hypothetical protein